MSGPSPPADPVGPAGGIRPVELGLEDRRGGWTEVLRNRRFLLLEATSTLAGAGYAVYSVSVLFLSYAISGNLLITGTVLFIEYGVYTATFLIAPIVDRADDKRSVLLVCYPVQAAAAAALALELRAGTLSVPVLLGLVFVLALAWDFVWAVFMVAPRLVLEKRQLFVGEGFAGLLSTGTQVGGYAGGGALVFFIGPFGGASAYAVLLVAALATAFPLRLPVDHPPRTRFWETFRRGWDSFRGSAGSALRALGAIEVPVGFFSAVPPLLITAIAYQRFAHPASVYGVFVTAFALGGSLTGVALGHLNPRRYVGAVLIATPVAGGLCLLALVPSALSFVAVAVLLAGAGGAYVARYSAKYVWVQGSYPPEMLGRLTANLYLFTGVSGSVAVLAVGVLSTGVPLATLVLVDGLGLIGAGLLTLGVGPLRRMQF